jgi:hypothetical protein
MAIAMSKTRTFMSIFHVIRGYRATGWNRPVAVILSPTVWATASGQKWPLTTLQLSNRTSTSRLGLGLLGLVARPAQVPQVLVRDELAQGPHFGLAKQALKLAVLGLKLTKALGVRYLHAAVLGLPAVNAVLFVNVVLFLV